MGVMKLVVLGTVLACFGMGSALAAPCDGASGSVCKCMDGSDVLGIVFAVSIPDADENRDLTATLNVGGSFRKKSKGSENTNNTTFAAGSSTKKKDGTPYTGTDTVQVVLTATNPACGPMVVVASTTIANLSECLVCPP